MSVHSVTFDSFQAQSATRVITTNTIPYNWFTKFTAYIEGRNASQLQYNFVGYNSSGTTVVDLYWYDSGTEITIPTRNDIATWRLWFRFSDNSSISPSDITLCTAEYKTIWHIGDDGLPYNEDAPISAPPIEAPYPLGLWRIESGEITTGLLPQADELGAFANAVNLMQVSIPRSCKKIGRYAFANTQLTSVTIASDCDYYDTSFPAGCVVNFYPD